MVLQTQLLPRTPDRPACPKVSTSQGQVGVCLTEFLQRTCRKAAQNSYIWETALAAGEALPEPHTHSGACGLLYFVWYLMIQREQLYSKIQHRVRLFSCKTWRDKEEQQAKGFLRSSFSDLKRSSRNSSSKHICVSAAVTAAPPDFITCTQYKPLTEVFLFKQSGPANDLSLIFRLLVRSLNTCL